ncbi:MAG: hypothetical protein HY976_00405 [Candidatus Kerfeldbacteria bacterium]|nr:hypothetical protein [Candidatus Kerfeldbacteria bacterium]
MSRSGNGKRKGRLTFEKFHQPLAERHVFRHRVRWSMIIGLVGMHLVMLTGAAGYHWIAQLPWIDAIHNASMILGGMGQVDLMPTALAKLYAAAYAFYAGPLYLICFTVMFSPVIHRWLNNHHLCDD